MAARAGAAIWSPVPQPVQDLATGGRPAILTGVSLPHPAGSLVAGREMTMSRS